MQEGPSINVRVHYQVARRSCILASRSQRENGLNLYESEYISLAECVEEILFLRQVSDLISPRDQWHKVTVFENNEDANQTEDSHISLSRSNQIYPGYHCIGNKTAKENIAVMHVESSDQCADKMTEGLPQTARFPWDMICTHRGDGEDDI